MIRQRGRLEAENRGEQQEPVNAIEFEDRERAQEKLLACLQGDPDDAIDIDTSDAYEFASELSEDLSEHLEE